MSLPRILILHGPNLQLLGKREVSIYGRVSLAEINQRLFELGSQLQVEVEARQSNVEGFLVDAIGEMPDRFGALIINPGAYTHTSVALRDAISGAGVWAIEVHLSNLWARESFRQVSYVSAVCAGVISGLGGYGYELALYAAARHCYETPQEH